MNWNPMATYKEKKGEILWVLCTKPVLRQSGTRYRSNAEDHEGHEYIALC